MGQKQEDIIRDFLAAWGDEQHRPDVERIVSMFATSDLTPSRNSTQSTGK